MGMVEYVVRKGRLEASLDSVQLLVVLSCFYCRCRDLFSPITPTFLYSPNNKQNCEDSQTVVCFLTHDHALSNYVSVQ